jgi:Putative zinc-finger
MSCQRYQEMLHLYRPGELEPRHARELEEHLRTCADCSALKVRIGRAEGTIKNLREYAPAHPDPERAIGAIAQAIRDLPAAEQRPHSVGWLDRLLISFEVPSVRFASALAILALAGGFLFQQVRLLNDVSDLEARLTHTRQPSRTLEAAYVIPPFPGKLASQVDNLLRLAGGRVTVNTRGQMTISQGDVEDLQETLLRQMLSALGKPKGLETDQKTIDELITYLNRNIAIVFRTATRGGTR